MLAIEIVPLILSFLLGMCVLYFTTYSKAKSKNRALQEAVSRLEDEKQKALAKYVTEKEKSELPRRKQRGFAPAEIKNQWDISTAEIKKPLAVDIKKRECPFDEKRQQFVNYCTLLDEFHRKSNAIFTLQFHPIMNRFLASNSVEDEIARGRAILEFNREVQALFNQLYEEQQKVNSETDSIRSFSSDTLDELLDKLESAVKKSTDDATEVLKFMATPELLADQSLAAPLQKAENSVQVVLTCRNAVQQNEGGSGWNLAGLELNKLARIAFEKIMAGLEDALAYADGGSISIDNIPIKGINIDMNWTVEFTNKVRKQKDKLPVRVRELLFQLVRDIQTTGPVRGDWPNYSKLSDCEHHCHIKKGQPTYVVVWREDKGKIRFVEVTYAGTHENAPY